jgi:branched-subunit amino acid transport protein
MSWTEFAILGVSCAITILIFRTVPLMALKGRNLPGWLSNALGFIPPAAFAALIANDLLSPTMFDAGLLIGLVPLIATACVIPVAIKTKSLVWCIVVGIGVYAALLFLV